MHFSQVLDDIQNLVNKPLQSINPKTAPIYITNVDLTLKNYSVSQSPNESGDSRPFTELEAIWNELVYKGFCNVDQALYGSGSSRNQPETVFAHLPYIQHFRFKGKKHIFLRAKPIHSLGTLSELTGDELSIVLTKIDNHLSLKNQDIYSRQVDLLNKLRSTQRRLNSGISVPSISNDIELIAKKLSSLSEDVRDSVVTIQNELHEFDYKERNLNLSDVKSVEDYIEDEDFTGIENESDDTREIDEIIETSPLYEDRQRDELRIRHITPVLTLIHDRLSFEEIELQPDFQRQDRIWSMEKRSKLLESILMSLPLPAFYFAEKSDGDWIVVDGLQRITTIFDFMKDRFPLEKLTSLDESYNGKYFSDLTRLDKRKIREYQITAHVIDADSDKENLIVELFHRINTYGVKLSNQEIRSAMYQGSSVTFLRYLSSSPEFITATNGKVSPQRQKDMELCLSALAYIAQGYEDFHFNTYNEFLSLAMKRINEHKLILDNLDSIDQGQAYILESSDVIFFELEKRFKQGLDLAHQVFDGAAFKKSQGLGKSSPISKPLFEVIVAVFGNLTAAQIALVLENVDEFISNLYEAIESNSSEFAEWESERYKQEKRGIMYAISASTGKRPTVLYRFSAFRTILMKSTGVDVKITPVLGANNVK